LSLRLGVSAVGDVGQKDSRKDATMTRYSVIIPQHDRGDDVRRQLPGLAATLEGLGEPYEVIVVDDGSAVANLRLLDKLQAEHHALRLLRLDVQSGASIALAAGIQAARGEVIVAMEAGTDYAPEQIPELLAWLHRGDVVVGRRRRFGAAKLLQRIGRIPRWLLLGLEGHDPDCLFWAARREVFGQFQLTAGMARYLPALAARCGFRVCETYVDWSGEMRPLEDVRANPGDLLAAWWACRRWRNQNAYELVRGSAQARPGLRVVGQEEPLGSAFRLQREVFEKPGPAVEHQTIQAKRA
jgi:glycosyltransferase involved in cell wall biosynthesis